MEPKDQRPCTLRAWFGVRRMIVAPSSVETVRTIIEQHRDQSFSDAEWHRYADQRLRTDDPSVGSIRCTFGQAEEHVAGLVLWGMGLVGDWGSVEVWGTHLYVGATHVKGLVFASSDQFAYLGRQRCERMGAPPKAPPFFSFQGIRAENVRVIEGPAALRLGLCGPVDKRLSSSRSNEFARIGNLGLGLSKRFNPITQTEEDVVEVFNVR